MTRVLHFHDAAGTGRRLVDEARREGLGWRMMDSPPPLLGRGGSTDTAPAASGPAGPQPATATPRGAGRTAAAVKVLEKASRPVRGLAFAAYLAARSAPFDLLHVHGAHKAASARLVQRPVAVHLHGSDIRLMQYAPSTSDSVQAGVLGADLVVYATPDLLEHAQRIRSDVHYLPVPISLSELPAPPPDDERKGAMFVSRWDSSKGGKRMLEIARVLRDRAPEIPLYGIDWGEGAAEARRLDVELRPKMEHDAFLRSIAGCRVAIGQANPMIGTSELEALALGLPLVGVFDPQWYPGLGRLGGGSAEEQARSVHDAHQELDEARRAQDGPGYVRREHDTPRVLSRLLELYGGIGGSS